MPIKQYVQQAPSQQVRSDFPETVTSQATNGNARKYAPPDRASMAFKEAPSIIQQRAIVSLEGERKSGKLHTALTAPEPIYLHSFDFGTEGVVEKFRNGVYGQKRIYMAEYPAPDAVARSSSGGKDDVMNEAIRVWQAFESQYYDSLQQTKTGGTVIVDTGGQAFELLTLAEFGRTERILPRNRGKINGRMAAMIRAGYGSKNAFWLHTVKDMYKDALDRDGNAMFDDRGEVKSVKTGERVHRGFADMPFIVQLVGRCERVDLPAGGSQFQIRIKDSRHNPWANGLVIENNFEALAWAIHEYMPEKEPVTE
jgi:hypothetical protein